MLDTIRNLIRKSLLKIISEAAVKNHATDRLYDRMSSSGILPTDRKIVMDRIAILLLKKFPKDVSYGIRLADLHPNPVENRKLVDGKYFRFFDNYNMDSTGNQLWAIVRHNEIVTVFLRKDYQTENIERNREKLRVDKVIMNFNNIDKFINGK